MPEPKKAPKPAPKPAAKPAPEADTETVAAPVPANRMVRVTNVSTRAIIEGGQTYKPGAELELTPERAAEYQQRVRIVRKS